jgi:hypothetical protein
MDDCVGPTGNFSQPSVNSTFFRITKLKNKEIKETHL